MRIADASSSSAYRKGHYRDSSGLRTSGETTLGVVTSSPIVIGARCRVVTAYHRCLDVLGTRAPKMAAYIDWCNADNLWNGGGPLNGQLKRQNVIRDICGKLELGGIIETGTYRGATTEFLAALTGAPVITIEANRRFFAYAERRFRGRTGVTTLLGDTRAVLNRQVELAPLDQPTLFYLDAHWEVDLPLAEELTTISGAWTDPVIIMDDFEVPGAPGYSFDDYGPGRRIGAEYAKNAAPDLHLFVPSNSPEEECSPSPIGYGVMARRERRDLLVAAGLREI